MPARHFAALALTTALAACATGSFVHIPAPPPAKVDTTVTVQRPREHVFDDIAAELARGLFTISAIDRQSGIITVHFADDPRTHINCGTFSVSASHALSSNNNSRTIDAASPREQYYLAAPAGIVEVNRLMALEGRANIVIRSHGNATAVTVSARYAVSRTATIIDAAGRRNYFNETVGANTGGHLQFNEPPLRCELLGTVEKLVLKAAAD